MIHERIFNELAPQRASSLPWLLASLVGTVFATSGCSGCSDHSGHDLEAGTAESPLAVANDASSATPVVPRAVPIAAPISEWLTVVNNGVLVPGTTKAFNAYNQPAINSKALVIFRARSKGGEGGGEGGESEAKVATADTAMAAAAADKKGDGGAGGDGGAETEKKPIHGIYMRNMERDNAPLVKVLERGDTVPAPNNLGATFNEFPSTPRLDLDTSLLATRGQMTPVWKYIPAGSTTETRIGTAGLFGTINGQVVSVAGQLGVLPEYSYLSVPGAPAGTKFDQFPGSPSPNGKKVLVFKGNYAVAGVSQTGVFFRGDAATVRTSRVGLIASSITRIPNQPAAGVVKFGSTAPPSAAYDDVVFTGFDNEAAPTLGGIYLAKIKSNPELRVLAGIGDAVPQEPAGATFTGFGEALSFDGRFVAFWGAWGQTTRQVTLVCPDDGEKATVAYCKKNENNKVVNVPANQGIFVMDTKTNQLRMVAKVGKDGFDAFLYWNFSGKPPCDPATGECKGDDADFEPPRWRSTSFVAVCAGDDQGFRVAFKGTKALVPGGKAPVQGIYLGAGPNPSLDSHPRVLDTESDGRAVDSKAPAGSVVSAVGIERDGFRVGRIALTASMLAPDPADPTKTLGWAGIYLTKVKMAASR